MLVLSRKAKEQLVIGNGIVITVQRITGNRVTLGIEAPNEVRIRRGELDQHATSKQASAQRNAPSAGSMIAEQTHVAIASRPLA